MKNNLGYGQALFLLALENNKLNEFKANTIALKEIVKDNPELIKLISSKQIDKEEKKDILIKVFQKDLEPLFLTGLKLMVDHNKFYSLESTLSDLNSLINKEINLQEGLVYSVKKLSTDQLNQITTKLEAKFNSKIELDNHIDKTLIDGVKVIVNNHVIDNSLSTKLENLKQEIIEGK